MHPTVLHDDVTTLPAVLSPDECSALVALTSGIGFTEAPITTPRGFVLAPEIRNNTRVILDDPARAAELWHRMSPAIPRTLGGWTAVGLNERFRFYRYAPGQRFAWHRDGAYRRTSGEASQLTLMVYLNDDFEGGETEIDVGARLVVRPETGMALVFLHPLLHQGATVTRGVKYVLRTDVMYRR